MKPFFVPAVALAFMLLSAVSGCAGHDHHAGANFNRHTLTAALPTQHDTTASAYPAPQEPLDHTPITPIESVGASRMD